MLAIRPCKQSKVVWFEAAKYVSCETEYIPELDADLL
jgi:hypothetical protein